MYLYTHIYIYMYLHVHLFRAKLIVVIPKRCFGRKALEGSCSPCGIYHHEVMKTNQPNGSEKSQEIFRIGVIVLTGCNRGTKDHTNIRI